MRNLVLPYYVQPIKYLDIKVDSSKPTIGISECLSESLVRYDGKSEYKPNLINVLKQSFNLLTVCPEVECGLGVPRPPVELVENADMIKVIGRDDASIDVSQKLKSYAKQKVSVLGDLSGYIFKARSPSCGLMSTPIFNSKKEIVRLSSGIFAEALVQTYPSLPVIENESLDNDKNLKIFIDTVNQYFQLNNK